ncbi:MAG: SMP-30/gluconolactonase/LRE family protein [Curvibacter sp.]|nr:SMP-30/gluconolactonase/LRE family protein [Curvibacter sp.]
MWNLNFTPPTILPATVLTRLPESFRQARRTDWVDANKPGHVMDSFLEGPVFDGCGNLYVTDIPYGRIFRIEPDLSWHLVLEYDGWPNGMALHPDGSLWIADYRKGILRLDPRTAQLSTVLGHRHSESFKGVNDLVFDRDGNLYFTDQGQTGLHDPTGRVYRLRVNGQLDLLLANAPSPNGLAVNEDASVLFVAVTRGNQVWRAPLLPSGGISKMGAFQTFFGTSGPDGMALLDRDRLLVAHASLGGVFVLNARGEVTEFLRSTEGATVTNVAIRPGSRELVMTESATGSILSAVLAVSRSA